MATCVKEVTGQPLVPTRQRLAGPCCCHCNVECLYERELNLHPTLPCLHASISQQRPPCSRARPIQGPGCSILNRNRRGGSSRLWDGHHPVTCGSSCGCGSTPSRRRWPIASGMASHTKCSSRPRRNGRPSPTRITFPSNAGTPGRTRAESEVDALGRWTRDKYRYSDAIRRDPHASFRHGWR